MDAVQKSARIDTADAKSPEAYLLQPVGSPVQVLVTRHAAERIEACSRDAQEEAAGLLLGSAGWNGSQFFTIRDVEPITWPRSMSPADRGQLEAVLAEHAHGDPSRAVVGYFRSSSREDLYLNAGDLALIKLYFPEPSNVVLLFRTTEAGNAESSRIFFWYRGAIRSTPSEPGQPFGRPRRAVQRTERGRPPLPRFLPEAETPSEPRRWAPWLLAGTGLAAAAFLVAPSIQSELRRWRMPAAPERPPIEVHQPLGLQVEKRTGDLVVKWDRNSPVVARASRAVLNIQDGPRSRPYELNQEQLRTGSIYYMPLGADVQFRLEIFDDANRPVVESIRVLSPNTAPGVPAAAPRSNDALFAAALPSPGVERPEREHADRTAGLPRYRTAPAPAPEPLRYTPPPRETQRAGPVEAPPPPEVDRARVAVSAAPGIPGLFPSVTVTVPRQEPPPAPRPAPPPVNTYSPPRPIRQSQAAVPPQVRSMLKDDVEIGVRMHIDEAGAVTRAEPVSRKGAASVFVTEAALKAAREWRFAPATEGGKPVPSEMVVNFRFVRQ